MDAMAARDEGEVEGQPRPHESAHHAGAENSKVRSRRERWRGGTESSCIECEWADSSFVCGVVCPRYELLLKEVSRQSTGVHPQLTVALSKIIEINVHVNDTKRLVDRVADLLLVQVKLGSSIPVDQEKIFPAGSLYMPHRRLIREGELTKRGTSLLASDKARKYYLFNDLLLSTNSHDKYKHHVLLHHAEVSPAVEGDDKADVDLSLAFHLHCHQLVADGKLQAGEKQLLFCSSASEKQAWIRDIDLAIQESNANMSANAGFLSVVPDRLRRMSDNKRESSLMKPAPSSATNPISPTSATSPGHLQKPSLSINGGPYSHSRKSSASASPRTPAPGHHSKHPSTASAPVAPVAATAAAAAVAVAAAPATHTKQPSSADAAAVTGGHSKHASAASNSAGHSKHPSDASASGGAVDDTPVVPSSPPELAPVFLPISLTPPEEPSEIIATTAIPQPASPSSPTPVLDSEVADPEPVSSPLRSPLAVDVGGDDSSADLEAGWRIASERMYRISRNDITALKMLKTPTPNVKLAMEAVGALLNVTGLTNGAMTPRGGGSMTPRSAAANNSSPSKSMKKLDDWTALHSLLVKPNFLSILKAFNERCDAMPEKADRKIAQLMQDPTMTPEAVSKASLPAGVLWNWVRSYWHLKKSGSNGAITIISIPTVPTPRPVATPRVSAIPRPASATVASKSPAKPRSPRASIAHTNGSATPRFDNVKSKIGSIRPQSATPATEPTPFTGELPPIADLVKCKMQYRDTFVNYYHPPTDTYFQMGVKDRALVPVPEPKQTQLRAAEAAAAARALKAGVMIAAARPSGTVPKKAAAPSTGTTPVPPVATASTPRSPSKLPVKTPPTALKPVRPTSAVSGSTTARTSLASKKPLAGSASATSLPRSSLRPPVDVAAGATQEKHKIAPALPHKKA